MDCRNLLLLFLTTFSPLYSSQNIKKLPEEGLEKLDEFREAIYHENIEDAKRLISKKLVNISISNGYHQTPLNFSSECGNIKLVKLMLAYGADAKEDSSDALRIACKKRNLKVMLLLIKSGANVNDADSNGQGMIHSIIELSFIPTETDSEYTALLPGKKAAIQLLLKSGAQLEAVDNTGHTPYLYLCHLEDYARFTGAGLEEIVELGDLLLAHGAQIGAQDAKGNTVMHYLASYYRESILAHKRTESLNSDTHYALLNKDFDSLEAHEYYHSREYERPFFITCIQLQHYGHLAKRFIKDLAKELESGESRKLISTLLLCMKESPYTKRLSKDAKRLILNEIISTLRKDFTLMIIAAPLRSNKVLLQNLRTQDGKYTSEMLEKVLSNLYPSETEKYDQINLELPEDLADNKSDSVKTIKTFLLEPSLALDCKKADLAKCTTQTSLYFFLKEYSIPSYVEDRLGPTLLPLLRKHCIQGVILSQKERLRLVYTYIGDEYLRLLKIKNKAGKSVVQMYQDISAEFFD